MSFSMAIVVGDHWLALSCRSMAVLGWLGVFWRGRIFVCSIAYPCSLSCRKFSVRYLF
jgi:hypothetical protein